MKVSFEFLKVSFEFLKVGFEFSNFLKVSNSLVQTIMNTPSLIAGLPTERKVERRRTVLAGVKTSLPRSALTRSTHLTSVVSVIY